LEMGGVGAELPMEEEKQRILLSWAFSVVDSASSLYKHSKIPFSLSSHCV
jgi:hypothetical protein